MDSQHLSSFALEAIAQETRRSPQEAERGARHLEGCEDCRRELSALRALREKFLRERAPRLREDAVGRLGRRRFFVWGPIALVPTFCATLAVWMLQRPPSDNLDRINGVSDIGIKGDASLQVFALRGERVFPVKDGDLLAAGDRLRFEVNSGGLPYLLIVSIDAAGHVSTYVPFGGSESLHLDGDKRFDSPGSVELDPVPGPERIFALMSREPVRAAAIEPALRALGARGPGAIREENRLSVGTDAQRSFLWENGSR